MRSLYEAIMAKFSKDIKLDFTLNKSVHAGERQSRHGSDENTFISDDEILETIKKCSERIIEDMISNKIDIGERFVVQDPFQSPMLNVVCQTHQGAAKDEIRVDIVTVIRTDKFWNTNKNWIIRIK